MTFNVSLTPQLENLVRAKVASGLYNSPSEVVCEALRLLEEHDELRHRRLETLRVDIQAGLKSGKGSKVTAEEVIRRNRGRNKKP